MAGSLRKRIERSDLLARGLAWRLAGYLRLCWRTGRWEGAGQDELDAALAEGPVTIICWHGRLVMAPVVWQSRGPVAIPRDPSPAGRLSAATQAHFATTPFEIDMKGGNFGPVRQVMRLVGQGFSLGLTADGPRGPDRVVKQAALDWARATGRPVFAFAWSSRRVRRLNTWDGLMLPRPFAGGAFVHRRWHTEIPRRPDEAAACALRDDLAVLLDATAAEADAMVR